MLDFAGSRVRREHGLRCFPCSRKWQRGIALSAADDSQIPRHVRLQTDATIRYLPTGVPENSRRRPEIASRRIGSLREGPAPPPQGFGFSLCGLPQPISHLLEVGKSRLALAEESFAFCKDFAMPGWRGQIVGRATQVIPQDFHNRKLLGRGHLTERQSNIHCWAPSTYHHYVCQGNILDYTAAYRLVKAWPRPMKLLRRSAEAFQG